ncbi:hypothetical protein N9V47_05965 [Luminiphilus sp.]|nr:hypothetical protein [Luminiphilus sp.]MDA8738305.1 hypothetical protein [Luminiphilus sp.]MDB2313183.1 hypothetical protein [Luminiphilus sp.]
MTQPFQWLTAVADPMTGMSNMGTTPEAVVLSNAVASGGLRASALF